MTLTLTQQADTHRTPIDLKIRRASQSGNIRVGDVGFGVTYMEQDKHAGLNLGWGFREGVPARMLVLPHMYDPEPHITHPWVSAARRSYGCLWGKGQDSERSKNELPRIQN